MSDEKMFVPSNMDWVDNLVSERNLELSRIQTVGDYMNAVDTSTLNFFFIGNTKTEFNEYRGESSLSQYIQKFFNKEKAIKYMDSIFWDRALKYTDVLQFMPSDDRIQWHEDIVKMHIPEFTEENIRNTIGMLLNQRQDFFAKRIDIVFNRLSREHVTNVPEGFRKRFIMNYCFDAWGGYDYKAAEVINDLRYVISKLLHRGYEANDFATTGKIMNYARNRHTGKWVNVDGNSFRMKAYQKGTIHFEVHPEVANKLNDVLSYLYPTSIPEKFRKPVKSKSKTWDEVNVPISLHIQNILSKMEKVRTNRIRGNDYQWIEPLTTNPYSLKFGFYNNCTKEEKEEVTRILKSIGAVVFKEKVTWFEFDYDPMEVIEDIVISGSIPDDVAFQYYPTPDNIAQDLNDLVGGSFSNDKCLEPSAGTGALAKYLPKDQTDCIELSAIRCKVLEKMGYNVIKSDFLEYNERQDYSLILMNPPYANGRLNAHLDHAIELLNGVPGSRIGIITLASFNFDEYKDRFDIVEGKTYKNAFTDASVDTKITALFLK